jgi:hypothetical protein
MASSISLSADDARGVVLEVKPGYRGRQNAYPAQVVTNSLSSGQLGVFDAF